MAEMFVNARRANAALRKLPDLAKTEAQKSMVATAEKVSRLAKGHAPVLSGLLKSSIQAKARKFGAVVGVGTTKDFFYVGESASPSKYWKFVEYGHRGVSKYAHGTRRQRAQPFMRPAALAVEPEHARTMTTHLERANDKMEAMAR